MGGSPYKILKEKTYFPNLNFDADDLILEIGSEWWDGHTAYLHEIALQRNVQFMTVDVVDEPRQKNNHLGINFTIAESGSKWCKEVLPTLNKKIKILHLDNFDWIYNPNVEDPQVQAQIESYAVRGVVMNNENSQAEHRLQIERCMPYMAEQSIIIMDDTYVWSDENGTAWSGKCGSAINLLIDNGYNVKQIWGQPIFNDQYGAIAWRGVDLQ